MQTFIRVIYRRLPITLVTTAVTLAVVMILAEASFYSASKQRMQAFSEALTNRSDVLFNEINTVKLKSQSFELYTPCSPAFLRRLRLNLWSFTLIKDIGWVQNNTMICTALWDKLSPPLAINLYNQKIQLKNSTWIINASIDENIYGNLVLFGNYVIVLSPHVFSNFQDNKTPHQLSFIISNKSQNHDIIKYGGELKRLESEKQNINSLSFITWRTCSQQYDFCVTSGGKPDSIQDAGAVLISSLFFISIFIGLLISLCINLYIDKKRSLEKRLLDAINKNKLHLVYQPIYHLKKNKIIGVEALLRWKDPDIGFISPDIFIPLAEAKGMMAQITQLVTRKAIHDTGDLVKKHNLYISINISSHDLSSPDYLLFLQHAIADAQFPASNLILEITERQGANTNSLKEMVERFKLSGFNIAIDDFGTGYSNLNWLSHLSIDEIKIDKSITDSIETDSLNKVLLPNLINLLKDMHPTVVFEGIEKQEQVDYLLAHFPNALGQGWFFSKALELSEIQRKLSLESHAEHSHPIPGGLTGLR